MTTNIECPNCDNVNSIDNNYCGQCGTDLKNNDEVKIKKKKIDYLWILNSSGLVFLFEFLCTITLSLILAFIPQLTNETARFLLPVIASIAGTFTGAFFATFYFKKMSLIEPMIGATIIIIISRGFLMSLDILLGTVIAIVIALIGSFIALMLKKRRIKAKIG